MVIFADRTGKKVNGNVTSSIKGKTNLLILFYNLTAEHWNLLEDSWCLRRNTWLQLRRVKTKTRFLSVQGCSSEQRWILSSHTCDAGRNKGEEREYEKKKPCQESVKCNLVQPISVHLFLTLQRCASFLTSFFCMFQPRCLMRCTPFFIILFFFSSCNLFAFLCLFIVVTSLGSSGSTRAQLRYNYCQSA